MVKDCLLAPGFKARANKKMKICSCITRQNASTYRTFLTTLAGTYALSICAKRVHMAFLISSVHHHERSSLLRMSLNLKRIICDYAELQQQIVLELGYCQFVQRVDTILERVL